MGSMLLLESELISEDFSLCDRVSSQTSDAALIVTDTESADSNMERDVSKGNLLQENHTLLKSKRSVSFDRIRIRNYDTILGDNPCTYKGPPISLDWDYYEQEPVLIHEYESFREGCRRKIHEMRMPSFYRRRILEQSGTTPDEIKMREKEMKRIRKNRERTTALLPFSMLLELVERVSCRSSVSCIA
jgi:hypothetical protein